jgi:hypothetical protein
MPKLLLVLLPWRKLRSKEEARRLTNAGAILIVAAALLGLASDLSVWADIPKNIPVPYGLAMPKALALADPISQLYLAAGIYLGYRSAAVAIGLWAFVAVMIYWNSPDPIGAALAIGLTLLCIGASAALRGTFWLRTFSNNNLRRRRAPTSLAPESSSAEMIEKARRLEASVRCNSLEHGEAAAPAEGDRTNLPTWSAVVPKDMVSSGLERGSFAGALLAMGLYSGNLTEGTRSNRATAPSPMRMRSGRVFGLRLAAVCVFSVGVGAAVVSLALASQLIGLLPDLSRPTNPTTTAVLSALALSAWLLAFWIALWPFFAVARRLWVLRFASILVPKHAAQDECEFAANVSCMTNDAVEHRSRRGVVNSLTVLARVNDPTDPFPDFRALGLGHVIIGCVTGQTDRSFKIDFHLWDVFREIRLLKQEVDFKAGDEANFADLVSIQLDIFAPSFRLHIFGG